MNKIDLILFDITAYLDEANIRYDEEGKNISEGWIGTACLWCDDHSNHLGINLSSKSYKCWKCHKKGTVLDIILEVEKCSYLEAQERLKEFQDPYFLRSLSAEKKFISSSVSLPKEATKDFSSIALNYLVSRNFSPKNIIARYDLFCTKNTGRYKFRIIIPVVMNNTIVGFTSRDYTDRADKRYLRCKTEESSLDPGSWIYNIDSISDKIIIVEGPTDVWRLGDGCISPLTSEFSPKQLEYLNENKSIKEAYIMFDAEKQAQKQANKIANNLSVFIKDVFIYELPSGDPASLSETEAGKIISEIF